MRSSKSNRRTKILSLSFAVLALLLLSLGKNAVTQIHAADGALSVELDEQFASDFCEKKWTKRGELNQRMYNYCMRQQRNGVVELNMLLENHGPGGTKDELPNLSEVLDYALERYTNPSNYQMNMVRYSVNTMIEGFLDVQYGYSQGEFNEEQIKACASERAPQWDMIHYCLKN